MRKAKMQTKKGLKGSLAPSIALPLLIFSGCTLGSTPANTSSTTPGASLIVQGLTPICASTLRDRNIIPQQARNLGVTEAAVCECGLRKVETRLAANPALILDILRSTDAQINLLIQVGGECAAEMLGRALLGQPIQSPSPGATPFPGFTPTPSPAPTFWPPTGP